MFDSTRQYRWNRHEMSLADVDAGAPHAVAIVTLDAGVGCDGGGRVATEHVRQSTSSTTSSGRCRPGTATKPPSPSRVPRSSACRQQCCDDSPLVALRVYHDRQRLSRTAASTMTSPAEVVTSPADHVTPRDGVAVDDSDSGLSCQPD